MDLSKLTYSKSAPEQEERKVTGKVLTKCEQDSESVVIPIVAGTYQKQDGVRSYSLVFVLSGGEKREGDFLKALRGSNKYSVRVVFLSKKKQGLQPDKMQQKWSDIKLTKEFSIDGQFYHLDDTDKVFMLSDVDEFYDQLEKILSENSDDRDKWLISNPCFEMWLYYCYKNDPHIDLSAIECLGTDKRSQELKVLCHTLVPGGIDSSKAFDHIRDGVEHSIRHFEEDENHIPKLYATKVFEMAKYILDTMDGNNDEYEAYLREKKEKAEEWKKKMKKPQSE